MPLAAVTRRELLVLAGGAALSSCTTSRAQAPRTAMHRALAALEGSGRLGVAVLHTGTGSVDGHRLDERFALCSTFKLVLAAMALRRASHGERALTATVLLREADLLKHAPITRPLLTAATQRGERSTEVSLLTLAHASVTASDGVAANLLLRDLGGPDAFTAFCRLHGDSSTRLDRYEPEMNDVRSDDPRDTTTPRGMARLVATLFATGLASPDRATLRTWMLETKTGAARVRAGLPAAWIAGDKTGTGGSDVCSVKANDVVWIEPPGKAPLVVAAYYDTNRLGEWPTDADEAVLAEVGRIVAASG
jgi:beta-lactamase class A